MFLDSAALKASRFEADPAIAVAMPSFPNSVPENPDGGKLPAPARISHRPSEANDFETILRVQYYAYLRVPSAEQKLLFAVLEDALRSYVRAKNHHSPASQTEFREVHQWFNDRRTFAVFSFESVCVNLDIDSDCIRKKLESLEPTHFPRQRLCNRRRLSERRSRAARRSGAAESPFASGPVRDSISSTPHDTASAG